MGHAKVRHHDMQRVQARDEEVGSPQVPVQDTQLVQMQQGSGGLLQQGQDTDQGQAALQCTIKERYWAVTAAAGA